jgi:serine/threonine-protein kinase
MELLEGESLAERIGRDGALAPAEAARVVATVADALEVAHRAGVVHRDVKPGNVFLGADGSVKLLDFGIASAAGEAALTTGDLIGTAAYLAPERALGHRATPAADVYALGVVLYELLAGRRPFEAASDIELAMAHVHAHPTPLAQAAPGTPSFLVAACEQAMSRDPSSRPGSAAAFARLLRDPAPTAPATRPLPAVGTAPARPRRRGLLVALVLVVAALAALPALAGGLLPWPGDGTQPPFAVISPGAGTPTASTDQPTDEPADQADPPAGVDPGRGDDHDREDDDDSSGSGSGRSGGGGGSGPG